MKFLYFTLNFYANFLNEKVVDLEQKSTRVQYALLKIISGIIQLGELFSIKTSSLQYSVNKIYSFNLPLSITFQNNEFKLPNFCVLTDSHCSNELITYTVNLN